MKNYEKLKSIAKIYTQHIEKIPSNPFKLANQLQIKCKTKFEFLKEYSNQHCPLYSTPAILCNFGSANKAEYVIFYDETSEYWNFYIFHEIAHYILGHEHDDPDYEKEANMLACLLIAPPNLIPSTFTNSNDLSFNLNIPIARAEEYWSKLHITKHVVIKSAYNHKLHFQTNHKRIIIYNGNNQRVYSLQKIR